MEDRRRTGNCRAAFLPGTLSQEAGEQPPEPLTKADAAKHIEELQQRTGRGQ